jgi:hypothetical protein
MKSVALLIWFLALSPFTGAKADLFSFDQSFSSPPLNAPLIYTRGLGPHPSKGETANILALVMDVDSFKAESFYPWPLYVQLRTNQTGGEASVINGRGYQYSEKGWLATLHSELIQDGHSNVGAGVNTEISKLNETGRAIGLNIQSTNGYAGSRQGIKGDEAINIQSQAGSGWKTGINLESKDIDVGIALNGSPIALDPERRFVLKYNPNKKRVELLLEGKSVWASRSAR